MDTERYYASNVVRGNAPSPLELSHCEAIQVVPRKRHGDEDRRNEQQLADLHADIEEKKRDWNCRLRQSNFIKRAGKTQPMQEDEREPHKPRESIRTASRTLEAS